MKWIIAACMLACGGADAATLTRGIYALVGQVASNNGNASCSQLNLTPGTANATTIVFPAGKTGFTLYVPTPGSEEICVKFVRQPTAGLNGYDTTATCTIDSVSGDYLPVSGVRFTFTAKIIDSNTAIGNVRVAIPNSPGVVGGGCTADVTTTFVRTGQ